MFRVRSNGSQSPVEQASCSRGTSQVVFISDTISKRSEMITTNGRVNNPFAAKGTCPNAGNWIHTQLPIPGCGPDCSITRLQDAAGGRIQVHPISAPKALAGGPQICIPSGDLLALRPKSSLLSPTQKALMTLVHCFVPVA